MDLPVMFRRSLPVLLVLLAATGAADTIYLTNGTSLTVDRARDKGDRIEYVMGGSTYTVPKKSVVRIESGSPGITIGPVVSTTAVPPPRGVAGGFASPGVSESKARDIAIPVPADPPDVAARRAALRQQITNLGQVDPAALAKIESQGIAPLSAAAYLEAGRMEAERSNIDRARQYFQQGLRFAPDSVGLLGWYGATMLRAGKYSEAATQAERITRLAPELPDGYRLLGIAYYAQEKTSDAVRAWQRAFKLRPDPDLQQLIARAQREANVEENFNQQETWHFSLRFDGQRTSFVIQRDLLRTLESQYRDLVRELDYSPNANIIVVLYTSRAFFDVTQMPSWAGGGYDGKLRIPVEGLQAVTPELERVLKHELVHAFLTRITNGRCPVWLHEGMAQMLEPRNAQTYGPSLAKLYQAKRQAPMKVLEDSFTQFSPAQASVAYAQSLAMTEYLRSTIGMNGLERMLQRIGSGESAEAALKGVNRTTYSQFEEEFGGWLARNYGQ